MRRQSGLVLALLCAPCLRALVLPALADPMPAPVEAMIRAAAEKNDATLSITSDTAKKSFPKSSKEIDRLVKTLRTVAGLRHRIQLRHESILQGWKGNVTAGGTNSTGNTRSTGVALGLNATREGLTWTHTFNATLDYQRDDGVETKARYFASYQANYKFNDNFYLLGLTSWEDNRFSGFTDRTSEGLGFGYSVIHRPDMTLSFEGGPALRQTDYLLTGPVSTFAPRAAVNYNWSLLPNVNFTENTSFYSEERDSTLTSNTGFHVGLTGSLSMQATYLAQYESDPATLLKRYNGTTRLTLTCSF